MKVLSFQSSPVFEYQEILKPVLESGQAIIKIKRIVFVEPIYMLLNVLNHFPHTQEF